MPVLKKRGALFPVYHDSPPPPPPTTSKKDVLSVRSPTLKHRKQSSLGSKAALTGGLKPSHSSLVASAALQSQTAAGPRKPLGSVANASAGSRAPLRDAREKENLRSLGMGKQAGKMAVFVDDEHPMPLKTTMETRLGTRRALGEKPAQTRHTITTLHAHKSTKPPSTAVHDPLPGRGQENIPPPGEYTADRPAPVRRSTRKPTSSFPMTSALHAVAGTPRRQHDSVLDPDSPYITKPRLRKVKPTSSFTPATLVSSAEPSSSSQAPLLIASSQPQSQPSAPILSSPLITRPQTRKRPSTAPSVSNPFPSAVSVTEVHLADPILCDVSEAYGAEPRFHPPTVSDAPRRSTRRATASRDTEDLPSSAYGWTQVSEGYYRAPEPPMARGRKGRKGTW